MKTGKNARIPKYWQSCGRIGQIYFGNGKDLENQKVSGGMRVEGCKQTKVSSIRLRIACLQVIMYGEITVHRYIGLLLEISLLLGVWSCPSSISVEFIRVLHKYFSPFTFKTC